MLINLRNALMAGKRLPYDAEVEYLESTGTQWIDTGKYGTANTVARISFSASAYTNAVFFGVFYANRVLFNFFIRGANWSYLQLKNSSIQTTSYGALNTRYDLELGNNYIKDIFSGTVWVSGDTQAAYTTDRTLKWFYYDRGASVTGKGKIYRSQIYESGVLVQDLIPVRKGTVGYLYDRVSGKLFGNAGTGAFGYGNDLKYPIPSE